jgi:hypothetical protein
VWRFAIAVIGAISIEKVIIIVKMLRLLPVIQYIMPVMIIVWLGDQASAVTY